MIVIFFRILNAFNNLIIIECQIIYDSLIHTFVMASSLMNVIFSTQEEDIRYKKVVQENDWVVYQNQCSLTPATPTLVINYTGVYKIAGSIAGSC